MAINFLSGIKSVATNVGYATAGVGTAASMLGAAELVCRALGQITPDCKEQKKKADKALGKWPSWLAEQAGEYTGITKARNLSRPFANEKTMPTKELAKQTAAAFLLSTALFEGVRYFGGRPSNLLQNVSMFQVRYNSLAQYSYRTAQGLVKQLSTLAAK